MSRFPHNLAQMTVGLTIVFSMVPSWVCDKAILCLEIVNSLALNYFGLFLVGLTLFCILLNWHIDPLTPLRSFVF